MTRRGRGSVHLLKLRNPVVMQQPQVPLKAVAPPNGRKPRPSRTVPYGRAGMSANFANDVICQLPVS